MTSPDVFFLGACLLVIGSAIAAALFWLSFSRPRVGLYLLLAMAPTQFIFIPVSRFFVSPADVVVLAAGTGLMVRLARRQVDALRAFHLHLMMLAVVAAYLLGFVFLDHFSRTLVRLPMAIVPSLLACELLRSRLHVQRAVAALITAGLLDAIYGTYWILAGAPLHPTRFSGMMGNNFSAMVIAVGACMAWALAARARQAVQFAIPAVLTVFVTLTLSRMALLAMGAAGLALLAPVLSPRNRRAIVVTGALIGMVAMAHAPTRERVLARTRPELQADGAYRTSGDVRSLILRSAWEAYSEQPVVGIGYQGFQPYSTRNRDIFVSTGGDGYGTHNTPIEVLVEGGLLAFIPFLLHFVGYLPGIRGAWRAVWQDGDRLAAATLSALLVVAISAMAANILLHYLFWSVCGVALASSQLTRAGRAS